MTTVFLVADTFWCYKKTSSKRFSFRRPTSGFKMAPEVVQIGSFVVSKSVLILLGPLLGALVGGLLGGPVTYFVMQAIERQKWRQEKIDRLNAIQREAIALALEWLDPMELAVMRASSLLSSHLQGHTDQEQFMAKWPHLSRELSKLDIILRFRVLLPEGMYEQDHRIVRHLDELRVMGVRFGQEIEIKKMRSTGLNECWSALDAVETEIEALRRDLTILYKETFK